MRKTFYTLTILFSLYGPVAHAQYFTVSLAGGYAWPGFINDESVIGPKIDPLNPQIDALGPLQNINDSIPSVKNVHGSYSHGYNLTLGLGYNINRYVNVGLRITYLGGSNISADQTLQLSFPNGIGGYVYIPYYLAAHITTSSVGLSVNPSVTLQLAKPGWKVYPYTRVGISLPVAGVITDHLSIDQNAPGGHVAAVLDTAPYFLGRHTDVTFKIYGAISLGFNGAIGVKYDITPYLSIFGEINGQYLNVRAKSAKITQWAASDSTNGSNPKNMISERGAYRTQFTFVNELTGTSNNAQYNAKYDPNQPKEDLQPIGPFSSLGFNVGLTFNLGKSTLKKKEKVPKAGG